MDNHSSPLVDIVEASALTGIGKDALRAGLIQGRMPYGYAIKCGASWRYIIHRTRLMAYINAQDLTLPVVTAVS